MTIKQNIEAIEEKITEAAVKSGRKREDITLVAVSKTVGCSEVAEAYDSGLRVFAENRVQCLADKLSGMEQYSCPDIDWHLIGTLQTNKVKYVVGNVSLIHSVDSAHLADEIDKCSAKRGVITDCLLQVNVSLEESKHGVTLDDADRLTEHFTTLDNVRLRGLMTMAPAGADEYELRKIFSSLYKKYIDIASQKAHNINMSYISMGMTNDYTYAIEEGSNMIRVGTGIFH